MDGNGFTTIVLSDYQVGSSMEVLTISKKGEVTGKLETGREITGLSVRGEYIAVLFSDGLGIYDNKMNEKAVERLKRKIILQENQNLKTRTMTDQQMVAWIKKQIEEEAQCYSNQ